MTQKQPDSFAPKQVLGDLELYGLLNFGDNVIGRYLQQEAERHGWDLLAYQREDNEEYGCYAIDGPVLLIVGKAEHSLLIEAIAGAILDAEIWVNKGETHWTRS